MANKTITSTLYNVLGLNRLTGPILDKELRVSSRRRRNYVLRFVYLGILVVFVALVWSTIVNFRGGGLYGVSRMAEAGKWIITQIVWFQFLALQVVALVMLSTAISDEIYNRTLGILMTTPVNSFQVIIGKLTSKLLQLLLLLGITLPLLAVIRVFGGVPWDFILSSFCITLTTVIFMGSASLFLSVFSRRAYVVIIVAVITMAVLFGLLPLLTALFFHEIMDEDIFVTVLGHVNPYMALTSETTAMFMPRMGNQPSLIWPLHCAIMLGGSGVIIAASVFVVRKAALRQIGGESGPRSVAQEDNGRSPHATTVRKKRMRKMGRSPVLWKELAAPLLRKHKVVTIVLIMLAVLALLLTYAKCDDENELDEEEAHIVYGLIFLFLGMLFTIVIPATCITSEKESRCLPLLLVTTVGDWQIIRAKLAGAIRRCLPAWMFLIGHVGVFSLVWYIHPVGFAQILIVVIYVTFFLCCSGIYFSSRFRHTTTAVVMNFALAASLWLLIPMLLALALEALDLNDDLVEIYVNANPFIHLIVILKATASHGNLSTYDWPEMNLGWAESTGLILAFAGMYICAGAIFLWRAKRGLRRNIF